LSYLFFALRSMDQVHNDFKSWRSVVALSEGVTVDMGVNWRQVENYCSPQVLLVMALDPKRSEFVDHPQWAVLMDTHQVIPLSHEIILSVTESDEASAEVDVLSALNSLTTYVEAISGGKKENAMRQLQILKRILR